MKIIWIFLLIMLTIASVELKPTPAPNGFPFTCLPKPGKGHRSLAAYRKWRGGKDEDIIEKIKPERPSIIINAIT